VGDELVIAHPTDELHGPEVAAIAAGPAIYLLAHTLFRLRMTGTISVRRLSGAAACVVVGLVGTMLPALVLGLALVLVLVAVIVSEQIAAAGRRSRGEPTPLERLEASA
jgi:low temperature requirement protein LtrA